VLFSRPVVSGHHRRRALTAVAVTLLALGLPASPAAAAPPDSYRIDGVDVASWQHPDNAPIDWRRVRAAGVEFATVKATEGSSADSSEYTNPFFRGDLNGARNAGLAVAPYHFYLGRTARTGDDQARYFIAALRAAGYTGTRRGELPPILDFEWDWKGGCPPYATVVDAKAWLGAVRAAFRRTPIIYTNRTFITGCMGSTTQLAGYPLQIAYYGQDAQPPLPPGWRDWLMWQWTASNCVDGVPTCHLTRSIFNGTTARLRSLARL
jgi:lysozyme